MKKLLFIMVVFAISIQAQFKYYDVKEAVAPRELTVSQKVQILDAYAIGKHPMWAKHNIGIDKSLVIKLYSLLRNIENHANKSMSGDFEGVPKTETQLELLNACLEEFNVSGAIMTAILNKMIDYSKKDGSGDWSFYKSQFGG